MKRAVWSIVFVLLLAMALNVAVAWGCAMWINLRPIMPESMSPERTGRFSWRFFERFDTTGASRVGWRRPVVIITDRGSHLDERAKLLPQVEVPAVEEGRFRDRRGWPFLAMQMTFVNTSGNVHQPTFEARDGIWLRPFGGSDERALRGIPLRPVWLGFITNTLLYAVPLLLLWTMPFAVRRVVRRRRRQCVSCGYDQRGSDGRCPECGAAPRQRGA